MKNISFVVIGLGLALAACGGDDDVAHGSTPVSELSAEQKTEVCESFESIEVDEAALARTACVVFANFGDCTDQAIDDCVAMAQESPTAAESTSCSIGGTSFDARGCGDVTVQQVYDCQVARLRVLEDVGRNATCDSVLGDTGATASLGACTEVQERCPAALNDGGADE